MVERERFLIATTTRAIAARAGCSEGLIQNYFGGKEGLLMAVMHAGADEQAAMRDAGFFEREIVPLAGVSADEGPREPNWDKIRSLPTLVEGGRITGTEPVLPRLGRRVRDVRQGPDGWLYVLTDEASGQLLRIVRTP